LSAPLILRGSNEPRFLLTLRGLRAPHLAPQLHGRGHPAYARLLWGDPGHWDVARCWGSFPVISILPM